MKKLLSLLSVLTISGTAIPITSATINYQKEKTIKNDNNGINYRQKNNLESLKRNKREIIDVKINNVPKINQKRDYWCGPAVGEAVLRYFGLNPLLLLNIQGQDGYQSLLAHLMQTTNTHGTFPKNLLNIINKIINERNLNNKRQYSLTTISAPSASRPIDKLQFYNLVRNSLENNVPVIVGYFGQLPESRTGGSDDAHFIIVTGVTGNSQDLGSLNYNTYINPTNGQTGNFIGNDLTSLFLGSQDVVNRPSYLLSYINPIQTSSLNINQTEPMDCDYGIGRNSSTFMLQNFCSNENSRNIRSANEHFNINQQQLQQQIQQTEQQIKQIQQQISSTQQQSVYRDELVYKYPQSNKLAPLAPNQNWGTCLPISDENPYFNKNKDKVTWYSRLPGHAGIQAFLSLKTAQVIEKFFFDRNENDFKRYLFNLFKKMPASNDQNDFWLLANCISQGFLEFHNKVLELEKINDDNKLIVVEIHANFKNFDFSHSNPGNVTNVFGPSVNSIYII